MPLFRANASTSGSAPQLAEVVKQSDEDGLRLVPQNALWRGDARYADKFGDLITDEWLRAMRESTEADLRKLDAIDRSSLGQRDRLVYDTFRHTTELNLKSYRLGLAEINARMPLDQLSGQHLLFPQFSSGESEAPYKTVKDYEDGLKRLDGFVVYLDRTIPRMREGIAVRQVLTKVVAEKVIRQLDDMITAGVEGGEFWKPIAALPTAFADVERERLTAAYRAKLSDKVLPAYRRVRDFMAGEYLQHARTGAPGLASMPGGDKLYQWNLESFTTTKMTAAEIHRLGLREVARITAEMEVVKRQLGFKGTLQQFFASIKTDPRFRFESGKDMLSRNEALRTRVAALLPRYFGKLPKAGFEVKPIPAAQESTGGGAYYQIGTPDGTRPGAIFVNTSAAYLGTAHRMTSLFLHEGIPGHHMQGSIGQEDDTLPEFLRFGYFLGFGEGWGLYCEWLGNEMGLYSDPVQRFGTLDMDMIRAQRLVIDTGLHAKGWSRAQSIQYVLDYSTMSPKEAEDAVDRYITWPGQATAYTVGKLFIIRLRRKAEAALGSHFDLRKFHDQLLDSSALPLTVLEAKIDNWIMVETKT
jgi:uncharacterized protein (DUF885 family)